MIQTQLKKGDVVQVSPHLRDSFFAGCLVIVTELKSFGVQGYVSIPGNRGEMPSLAFCRFMFEDVEMVGRARWVSDRMEETDGN